MSEQLDLDRLGWLIRGDLLNRYRPTAITTGVIAGIVILVALLFRPTPQNQTIVYWVLVAVMLFVWGPGFASQSFIELHDKTRNDAYLLLPASALEKVLARLILCTAIFPVFALIVSTAIAWVATGLRALVLGISEPLFVPYEVLTLQTAGLFIVNQAMFFLGAAWFRKQHFMKTALTMTAASLGLFLFAGLVARIVFPDFGELMQTGFRVDPSQMAAVFRSYQDGIAYVAGTIFYIGIPVFCWAVAWMRLKETQVSHGI